MKTISLLMLMCGSVVAQDSWTVRPSGTAKNLTSIAFGNGAFVAVDGRPLRSTNGVTWTRPNWVGAAEVRHIAFGGGRFIAVESGTPVRVWLSTDSVTASSYALDQTYDSYRQITAAFHAGSWFLTGIPDVDSGFLPLWKINPVTGAASRVEVLGTADSVFWAFSTGSELLVANDIAIFASLDGAAWLLRGRLDPGLPYSFGGRLFAGGYFSQNSGATWLSANIQGNTPSQRTIITTPGVVIGISGSILSLSNNAESWTFRESGTTDQLSSVAFGNNLFVAVGNGGRLTTSPAVAGAMPDVIAPTLTIAPSVTIKWPSVAGRLYQIQYSADLQTWNDLPHIITGTGLELSQTFEVAGDRQYFRATVR